MRALWSISVTGGRMWHVDLLLGDSKGWDCGAFRNKDLLLWRHEGADGGRGVFMKNYLFLWNSKRNCRVLRLAWVRLPPCIAVFPPSPPPADSSSSETETEAQPSAVLRRRRTRRPTVTQAEVEEPHGEQPEPQGPPGPPPRGHVSGTLNKCILLALVVAISMGFGHFYGETAIQQPAGPFTTCCILLCSWIDRQNRYILTNMSDIMCPLI